MLFPPGDVLDGRFYYLLKLFLLQKARVVMKPDFRILMLAGNGRGRGYGKKRPLHAEKNVKTQQRRDVFTSTRHFWLFSPL